MAQIIGKDEYFMTTRKFRNAILDSNMPRIQEYIKKGYLDAADENGNTPLSTAIKCQGLDMCEFLISQEPRMHMADSQGDTPLHYVSHRNWPEKCNLLLANKADPNTQNTVNGNTPLMSAISTFDRSQNTNCCQLLLQHSANPRLKNLEGKTAMQMTAENGWVDAGRLLLQHDKTLLRETDEDCLTLLHLAAKNGNDNYCRMLIVEFNITVNQKGKHGVTALHLAVGNKHPNVCETLLQHGAY